MDFLIKVSTSWGQITTYLCRSCETTREALERVSKRYETMKIIVQFDKVYGALEAHKNGMAHYVSDITQLDDEEVVEVCDEYPPELMN